MITCQKASLVLFKMVPKGNFGPDSKKDIRPKLPFWIIWIMFWGFFEKNIFGPTSYFESGPNLPFESGPVQCFKARERKSSREIKLTILAFEASPTHDSEHYQPFFLTKTWDFRYWTFRSKSKDHSVFGLFSHRLLPTIHGGQFIV